jgi:uncharacterized membrane protein
MSFTSMFLIFMSGIITGAQSALMYVEGFILPQDYIMLGLFLLLLPLIWWTDPVRQRSKMFS